MKRSRVGRMLQILTALQSGRNNRVDDLAEMCTLSKRTIFRDLRELKEIGVPCRYNTKTASYSTGPGFFLTPTNLNRKEAMGVLLLVMTTRSHLQIPFKKETLIGAMKLEDNLPGDVRQYCNAILGNIRIKAGPEVKIELFDRIFEQLEDAILKKKVVHISYDMPDEKKTIAIELDPYHLIYNDYRWYVLGKSGTHGGIQAFGLNRIKELSRLDKGFVKDEDFDINEYLGKAWSLIPEGRLYHVKLRFSPEVAHNVAEVNWHRTQIVAFKDDGSAIVEFRVDGLEEITWWILGYGDKVEVLAPLTLRQRIVQIAQKMVQTNQQELPLRNADPLEA
jgi:predicted DNA-binding transcriptional regulator YafY